MAGVRGRIDALASWWRATRAARALARFGVAGGGLLTGGIAYAALFSAFSALALGWTVFMAVLGGNDELRTRVLATLTDALPGLVATDGGEGLIEADQLRLTPGLSIAGVVAVVTLVLGAVSAVAALRTAVRAMFAAAGRPNAVLGKVRELAGLVGIAVSVLVSSLLGIGVTAAADWLGAVLDRPGVVVPTVRVAGVLLAFVVDAATFVLVVRFLADQKPDRRDLLGGAAIAAVGLGALRLLGTSVVAGSVRSNPALAPFALVVVLLAWINLMARVVLLAAAWTADPPSQPQVSPTSPPPPTTPSSGAS